MADQAGREGQRAALPDLIFVFDVATAAIPHRRESPAGEKTLCAQSKLQHLAQHWP